MKIFTSLSDPAIVELLRQGAVGVIPTDTLYGTVAVADNQASVERVYAVRQRDSGKACVVLVGSAAAITDNTAWQARERQLVATYWPGKVSIILPTTGRTPWYLHRGLECIAFRNPDHQALQTLLNKTGPLIAPSANPQGQPPARTIQEAQAYFGETVDFYVDAGRLQGEPSTLVKVVNDSVKVLRSGTVVIDEFS